MSHVQRTKLENNIYVHSKKNGHIVLARKKYEGPLSQDRFEEIELSTVGAQLLLDFLMTGESLSFLEFAREYYAVHIPKSQIYGTGIAANVLELIELLENQHNSEASFQGTVIEFNKLLKAYEQQI
jgi:hypothetical protein